MLSSQVRTFTKSKLLLSQKPKNIMTNVWFSRHCSSPVFEYLMRTVTQLQTVNNTNGRKYAFNNSTVTIELAVFNLEYRLNTINRLR